DSQCRVGRDGCRRTVVRPWWGNPRRNGSGFPHLETVEAMDLSDPSVLYHEGYQQGSVEEKALRAAEVIAAAIASEFQPDSVLDVGSGAGALVRAFLLLGKDSRGVDGSLHIKHVAEQVWGGDAFLDIADLRKPYFAGRKFDVVTCFDVAEH